MKPQELRQRFINDFKNSDGCRLLVTAVQLPTGAIETITNTEFIPEKLGYLLSAYDDQFELKANPKVKIVGYLLV